MISEIVKDFQEAREAIVDDPYSLYHMLKLDAYLIWERMRERLYGTDVLCTLVLSFVCEGR